VVGEGLETRRLLTTFYVDTNNSAASDSNAGTSISSPLKTIDQALVLAASNNSTSQTDTILIRGGVYREMPDVTTADSGASAGSRTVISAYFNSSTGSYEPVYIDAADPTTGTWIEDGTSDIWYLPNFTTETAGVWVDWSPSNDGASLQQIGVYPGESSSSRTVVGSGLADMYAGTYWGDSAGNRLYVWLSDGSNPNNHTIEYANRSRAIYQPGTPLLGSGYSYAQYLDFENLNLRHANVYNNTGQDPGVGIYTENDQRIINCTVNWNTRDGIHLQGTSQLLNCTANDNGGNGVAAKGSGWTINGGHCNYNYWRHYYDGSDAGIKVITDNALPYGNIENIEAAWNYGQGIWYDTDYSNDVVSDITGNYVHDNQGEGIDLEASRNFLVANNVVTGNADGGIVLNATENASICNNTLAGNYGIAAIELDGGVRTEEYNSPAIIGTLNNTVEGNIIANNFTDYDLDIPTSAAPSAEINNNTSDRNLFYHRGGALHFTTGGTYIGWGQTPSALSDWQTDSGQDAHSIMADPMFVSGGSGSSTYQIGSTSPAITAALVKSSLFTTDFAGTARPTTGGYDVGAFQHSTTDPGTAGPIDVPAGSVWMEDDMPANAAMTAPDSSGNTGENQFFVWNSSNTYSGAASLDSTAMTGAHRQYFTNAGARAIAARDTLFGWVWIDPANLPGEIMFEWRDSAGSWGHDAYWGQNLLTAPVSGSGFSPQYIGALPAAGGWALLSLPASTVGLAGQSVTGFSFDLYNGRALLGELGNGTVTVAATPSIAGTVFLDRNENGVMEAGEPGIAGVTVFLDLNGDGQLDPGDPTAVTDASGNYAFYNLADGSYTVGQVVPAGFISTPPFTPSSSVAVSGGTTATENLGEFPTAFHSRFNGDNFIIALSADQTSIDIWQGTAESSPPAYTLPEYNYQQLDFYANGFASSFTVDEINGFPQTFGSISFDGGSAGGSLIFIGNPTQDNSFNVQSTYLIGEGVVNCSNVGAISIIGGSGDDTLTIGSTAVPISFAGGGGNDAMYVDSGNYTFNSDPGLTTSNLTVNVAGGASVTFAGNTSGSSIQTYNLAGLNLAPGSLATLALSSSTADRSLLILRSLTFDESSGSPEGVLDIGNGDVIVRNGDPTLTTAALAAGYSNGDWNGGNGIISTAAANDSLHITAVGMNTGIAGSFDGQSISSSDVVLKYTYYGDAALGGNVGVADTTRLDFGYLIQATGWFDGDFNYDGVINGSDFSLFDNAYNMQGAALASQITAQVAVPLAQTTGSTPPTDLPTVGNRSGQSLALPLGTAAYLLSDPALIDASPLAETE
jgi:parallel beta-helix repeat protein